MVAYGGLGGFCMYAIPNLWVLVRRWIPEDGVVPKRFRRRRFYFVWFLSTAAGGLAAWIQDDKLQYFHQLCWQIGAAYPAFFSAFVKLQPRSNEDPGSAAM